MTRYLCAAGHVSNREKGRCTVKVGPKRKRECGEKIGPEPEIERCGWCDRGVIIDGWCSSCGLACAQKTSVRPMPPGSPEPAANGQVTGTISRAQPPDPRRRGGRPRLTPEQKRESERRRRATNTERMRRVRAR